MYHPIREKLSGTFFRCSGGHWDPYWIAAADHDVRNNDGSQYWGQLATSCLLRTAAAARDAVLAGPVLRVGRVVLVFVLHSLDHVLVLF